MILISAPLVSLERAAVVTGSSTKALVRALQQMAKKMPMTLPVRHISPHC